MGLLKAKHWHKYGVQAAFEVGMLAANNSPPMRYKPKPKFVNYNTKNEYDFSATSVFLVQEAYNIIAGRKFSNTLRPIHIGTGSYDLDTAKAIKAFQSLTQLNLCDGAAGTETLMKMDQFLMEFKNQHTPASPTNFLRDIFQGWI